MPLSLSFYTTNTEFGLGSGGFYGDILNGMKISFSSITSHLPSLNSLLQENDHYSMETSSVVDAYYYLRIYGIIACVTLTCLFLRTMTVLTGSFYASKHLHISLLSRILKAPVYFFDENPLGRILNRFTKDMQTLDKDVGNNIGDFLGHFIAGMAVICVITWASTYSLLGVIPIGMKKHILFIFMHISVFFCFVFFPMALLIFFS